MTLGEAVAKRIQGYCDERNITLNKLCTMAGIIQSTAHSLFTGKSTNPKLATIYNICIGLQISITEFFDSPLFSETNIES